MSSLSHLNFLLSNGCLVFTLKHYHNRKKNFHLMATLITGRDPDVNWCQSLSAGDFNAQNARSPLTKTRSRGAEAGHTCCTCTPITGPGGQCIEETWEGEVILSIRAFVTHRDKVNFKTLMRIRIKAKNFHHTKQKMMIKSYIIYVLL